MVLRTYTFLFADLCDYTEYSWVHGDDCSAELAVGFHRLVRALVAQEGCELVKTVGDGVMVRAPECAHALALAHRLQAAARELGYPQVRVGIDTGPAVPRDGDWYGTTVNRAARVVQAAAPGELLLTDAAREAAATGFRGAMIARGPRRLKGLPECLLHAARAAA